MPLELKIPERILDNFGDPINHLFQSVKLLNENPDETEVILDFSQNRFITPALLGGLSCLINNLAFKEISVNIVDNEYIHNYLSTIYFPGGYTSQSIDKSQIETNLLPFNGKTYIPIVCFPANNESNQITENMLSSVNNILKLQLGLSGNVLAGVYYLISELTQNIIDHSGTDKGYLFAQFFRSKNYMDICIADSGKGIRQSYLESGKFIPSDDVEAIRFAMNGKSTKPLPDSRGFGLSTSRRMLCKGLKGKFFLWSGNAFMHQNIEKEEVINLPEQYSWKGCYVVMRVPISNDADFNIYNFVE